MAPRDDLFQPEHVDEQIERLTLRRGEGVLEDHQSISLVQHLQDYYLKKKQNEVLENAWECISQKYEHVLLAPLENERILLEEQRNGERLPVMGQMIEIPTTSGEAPKKNPRSRLAGLFAALLCLTLIVSALFAVLPMMRAQKQAHLENGAAAHVKSTPVSQGMLPVPSKQVIFSTNPAAKVVDFVGMSNRVNESTGLPYTVTNTFTVDETVYLVCSVTPPKDGALTIKWFSDGKLYQVTPTTIIKAHGQQQTTILSVAFGLPGEGKAQIYWNNELAATLLFVVEPKAAF